MPMALRRRLPGLQPQRADIICAGALIVQTVLEDLDLPDVVASEADLLWGALLAL
jgi:exopolyphosphatase/guanosine-5'-triphosphate,3'-diphosphate pyrophosphatase